MTKIIIDKNFKACKKEHNSNQDIFTPSKKASSMTRSVKISHVLNRNTEFVRTNDSKLYKKNW